MTIQILMPALSPTMTEGKLVVWHKQEGDAITPGDVIAEIETDKATMEIEAIDEGIMGKILVATGTEGVPVNALIAIVLEDGESAGDIDMSRTADAAPAPTVPTSTAPIPAAPVAPVAPAPVGAAAGGRIFASPLARRMAEQAGVDLSGVAGSGPNGRVVKMDVEAVIASGPRTSAAPDPGEQGPATFTATPPSADVPGLPTYDAIPNTMMRKVIARRLTESKQFAPHFYMTVDCEIDALLATRKTLNEKLADGKVSVNDLVIKATAIALKQVPAANASWTESETRVYHSVDISVAVAIEGGLITPVIRGAQNKGLAEIASEMKDLAARARDGKLMPEEYQGGTFSISNLGMFGVKEFAAVINPPQGAILAVGAGAQRAVVKDGALAIATVMSCTLSVDHRVVDGAIGAEFLVTFKKLIEDPLTMLL
jgi:pyruvate dehydrogenase E2 component (dihydrolipoamide acetyltransferase)